MQFYHCDSIAFFWAWTCNSICKWKSSLCDMKIWKYEEKIWKGKQMDITEIKYPNNAIQSHKSVSVYTKGC